MAAYFGEILEPTTRAIFEDFGEEEEDISPIKLQLSWLLDIEFAASFFDLFFIIHGRLSLAFAETYLVDDNLSPIGEIHMVNERKLDTEIDDSKKSKALPSRIYQKNGICICLVSPSLTPEFGHQFVETINTQLKNSAKVNVLTSDSLYEFKTDSYKDLPPVFLKELKSRSNESKFIVDELPIPNIVTGIPAAVLSWCQIFQKSASVFTCYSDQEMLDSVTASPFFDLLTKINCDNIRAKQPNPSKKLFYGKPGIVGGSSNLYI